MNPIINIGIKAARQAGNTILRYVDRIDRLSVEVKGRNDFVSEVDRMAEDEIIEIIQAAYPDHGILAEESGTEKNPQPQSGEAPEFQWIIDPLDGTTNFLHGHPDFAVSIGVIHKGNIEHGIIFDPLRNDLYTASRNQGAQLNGRRMRVSGHDKLKQGIIGTGYPSRDMKNYDTWLHCLNTVIKKSGGIRISGCASLDLVSVACGRTDAFWEPGLKPWDLAAGCLMVREARGFVSDFDGEQDFLENGNVIAANRKIFNDLLTIIRSGSKGVFQGAPD